MCVCVFVCLFVCVCVRKQSENCVLCNDVPLYFLSCQVRSEKATSSFGTPLELQCRVYRVTSLSAYKAVLRLLKGGRKKEIQSRPNFQIRT